MIAAVEIEAIVERVMATVEAGEDVEARVGYVVATGGPTTYVCPICGRLLVFWNGIEKKATFYRKEDEEES
ncbi:MAG TPA: hypothetical protein VF215_00190 [Thermoanaerobaculia bacterium]